MATPCPESRGCARGSRTPDPRTPAPHERDGHTSAAGQATSSTTRRVLDRRKIPIDASTSAAPVPAHTIATMNPACEPATSIREPAIDEPAGPTEIELLAEIRDALKKG